MELLDQHAAFKGNSINRINEDYQQTIRNHFSFLKKTTKLDDLYTKSIPLEKMHGYLLPVCELHVEDTNIIAKLADWRRNNSAFFPSQFPVTLAGTKKWLRDHLLNREDRMLFLVMDAYGAAIGHLGFANGLNAKGHLEVDNVVRGKKNSNAGIMQAALEKLIDWAEVFLSPSQIFLRVFDDNTHAINFYKKLGFVENISIPLKKHIENEAVFYRPLDDDNSQPDKFYLRMNYSPDNHYDSSIPISIAGPSISAREISYVNDAARTGWNANWNGYIKRFENSFAEYLGVKHALTTSSCTGALHIALAALGIGPGDEVIVPDLTWVATANAVVYVGATPIFADINKESWCLEPKSFEACITERTKAVIAVHLYGHPASIDEIVRIARKHGLYVIEDAAPSIGAEWKGKKTGTLGDFSAFSFQGAKLTVSGEGGMLVTNNDELYQKAYAIADQGRVPNTFWINQNGLKYKMSNVQAAIGLGQLERVRELVAAKRKIFYWYEELLQDLPLIKLNNEISGAYSIYWMTSLLLFPNEKISRDELRAKLKENNIDTRPVFPAISQYPHWPVKQSPQPNAFYIGEHAINLPSSVCLKKAQVNYICKTIRKILTE